MLAPLKRESYFGVRIMSDDEKKGPAGLGSNGAIVVALFATGAYFYAQQAPLTVVRPPPMESRIEEKFHAQDVEARLWQDPFEAVAREIKRRDSPDKGECDHAWAAKRANEAAADKHSSETKGEAGKKSERDDARATTMKEGKNGAATNYYSTKNEKPKLESILPLHCRSPLIVANGSFLAELEGVSVIAVTAPGGRYFEDAETRRRLRFAILSGLHLERYTPKNEQQIGYFHPMDHEEKGLPAVIPFEWFERTPNKQREPPKQQILLVWIDEDVLGDAHKPLAGLSHLRNELCAKQTRGCPSLQILGPYSSGVLRDLAVEMNASKNAASLDDIRFYSFAATISEHALGTVDAKRIFRTSSGDNVLAREIGAELCRRNKSSPRAVGQNYGEESDATCLGGQHVALISDRDTLYGRAIVDTFVREFSCLDAKSNDQHKQCLSKLPEQMSPPDWILVRTYLRGIDGLLPPANLNKSTKKGGSDKDSGERSESQESLKSLERSFGSDQFDYLRRLEASLKKKDADLRRLGKDGVKAIGVLGFDVFDKLLVLRALKPSFPEAVFFTTDYDAALAGRDEIEWSRNLIVASSYGPTLADDIQEETAPFRSTYQTAAFLTARVAAQERRPEDRSSLRRRVEDSVGAARLFEIDRHGDFLALWTIKKAPKPKEPISNNKVVPTILTQYAALDAPVALTQDATRGEKAAQISEIQPAIPPLFTELSPKSVTGIFFVLLLTGVIVPFFSWRLFPILKATPVGMAIIFLFGAALVFRWDQFAQFATEDGLGEPIAWTRGISTWPSIGLRIVAAILALSLIVDAWRELSNNQKILQSRFFLPKEGISHAKEKNMRIFLRVLSTTYYCVNLLFYSLPHDKDSDENIDVDHIWRFYVLKNKFVPKMIRIVFFVSIMLCLFQLLVAVYGDPNLPWRGDLYVIYKKVTLPLVLLLLFLTFLVFDATLLCLRFVDVLRKNRTVWPSDTHKVFRSKFKLQDPLLDEWIDLDFLAVRTRCISRLIYFPFAIFALMIVSRSTVFAEFAISWPIIITQIIGCAIVFGCAMALCFSAEKARETTRHKLMKGIVAARAADPSGRKPAQLETLLKLVDGLRQGSFVPLSQQPPIRALLLPIGGLGWTALLDYRLLPGL
jgi:hypothetical protein